ncbi:MAG: GNAT family N-acetyltransferase [Rhodovibrionaceae bacterium]|nr:GNAT family N-acetyltransferase [Rhodovibrionaceae bacterium]
MPWVRRLTPADTAALRSHFLRLDAETRCQRFLGQQSDTAIDAYVDGLPWLGVLRLGWIESGVLRGVVELLPERLPVDGRWPPGLELALTVERAWQGRGLGTELVHRALLSARNRQYKTVEMICLADNVRMQRIARRLDAQVLRQDGHSVGRLRLAPGNPLSLWQEALSQGASLVNAAADQGLPPQYPPAADGDSAKSKH